jgi:hypothetical protein
MNSQSGDFMMDDRITYQVIGYTDAAHHDDPVADIAYLDADTGSIEWQVDAPTYRVVTEQPRRDDTVVELSGWKQ